MSVEGVARPRNGRNPPSAVQSGPGSDRHQACRSEGDAPDAADRVEITIVAQDRQGVLTGGCRDPDIVLRYGPPDRFGSSRMSAFASAVARSTVATSTSCRRRASHSSWRARWRDRRIPNRCSPRTTTGTTRRSADQRAEPISSRPSAHADRVLVSRIMQVLQGRASRTPPRSHPGHGGSRPKDRTVRRSPSSMAVPRRRSGFVRRNAGNARRALPQ